ncbi:type II toxin-antitoxin system death-on-curing family toxin [Deinococcus ficus]|uniref:type II toxin-antitoxin system death-on-curing family toxin n=1 Tax=Deinococcus ficus TaxID=317577 RepID=UPI000A061F31|nr:Fic family protein [Deinococcus ficus]
MNELTYDDVVAVHWALVEFFQDDEDSIDPPGIKNQGLLHSSIARPSTSMGFGEDVTYKYNTGAEKAAALLHSLIKNHAFHNGNKRTALVSAVRFLDLNKFHVNSSEGEYFTLVVNIAKGTYPEDVKNSDDEVDFIARWFDSKIQKQENALHNTTSSEFIERCVKLGVKHEHTRDKKHHILRNGRRSTKIAVKHRTLQGAVQRQHLKSLGLSRGQTGMRFAEFQDGANPNKDIIQRLILVLRQLAAYDREQEA